MKPEESTRVFDMREAAVPEIQDSGAIFIGQLRYWQNRCGTEYDGDLWIYNTYEDWHKQFPSWSLGKVKTTIKRLEEHCFIRTTSKYNRLKYDKTKWYAVNDEKIAEATAKFWQRQEQILADRMANNCQSNTKEYSKNTTKNNRNNRAFQGTAHSLSSSGYSEDILHAQFLRIKPQLISLFNESRYNTCRQVVAYYMEKYAKEKRQPHPILADSKLIEVSEQLIRGTEVFEDLIEDTLNYVELIQTHFSRDYGMQIDYNICHFATEGILEKLAYEKLY